MMSGNRLVVYTLVSILIAILIALAGRYFHIQVLYNSAVYLDLAGKVWILTILIIAVPLSGSYIVSSILTLTASKAAGRMSLYAFLWLLIFTVFGVCFSLVFVHLFLDGFGDFIPKLSVTDPQTMQEEPNGVGLTTGLISEAIEICKAIQRKIGNIFLMLVVLSIGFAFVVHKIRGSFREKVRRSFTLLAAWSLSIMKKFLISMPLGVFCLIMPLVLKTGHHSITFVLIFTPVFCVLLLLGVLSFYPAVHFFGFVSISKFAKDMIPAQLFAISSSSSLATLPSLLECAENKLKMPSSISGLILPFFVTSFKMNYAFSGAFQLIFFAFVFEVDLSPTTIALFILSHLAISLANPGIPGGAFASSLPFYIAAGVPAEAYLLSKTLNAFPDMCMTLINTTGPMTVATIVSKKFMNNSHKEIQEKPYLKANDQ